MNGHPQAPARHFGFVAAAVLLLLLAAVASPSSGVLLPVAGPVAAVIADVTPSVRQSAPSALAPRIVRGVRRVLLPCEPPLQRNVLAWGLPPPRAPSA